VAGASVTTTPATTSMVTGSDGRVRFSGLEAGSYAIAADAPSAGKASAQVSLRSGESRDLTLILRKDTLDGGTDDATRPADAHTDAADGPDAAGDAATTPRPVIVLDTLSKDSNGVNLRWVSEESFPAYRIYRSQSGGFSVVDILNDPLATTYRDATVAPGTMYSYRVAGVASDGSESSSNVQSISAGVFIAVNSQVERMLVDPRRPYLYAIDRVNNSLHFVNLTSQAVDKTIFVGSAPTSLDINMAGSELYVANSGSTEIAVVDLTTREKARSLLVEPFSTSTTGYPYRVAATTGNTLVFASQDSFSSLRLANAATGATLATATGSYAGPLVASPDGTRVYTGGYYLTRYDIVGATIRQVDRSTAFESSTYPVSRSGDGAYLFYGSKKVLSTNLVSTLGTFPELIQVASANGGLAVGTLRVYDGNTFIAKATLPLSASLMAISPDDKTLYLYQSITSRIYLWKLP
jgi:DNA-binding beta-propeller fold protein YncE